MRKARSAPLNAVREATRTQDLQRESQRQRRANVSSVSSGFDAMGLVNRRAKAFLDLPTRIARCRSPFEVWSVQARFIQEGFSDYAHHVTILLRGLDGRTKQGVTNG
jgi:hypothetical protein